MENAAEAVCATQVMMAIFKILACGHFQSMNPGSPSMMILMLFKEAFHEEASHLA